MNIDLDELERKAKAAGKYECGFSWPDESEWLELFDHCHKHGRFISALNPSVAQELINRLRDAEEQTASLLKLVTDLRFALGDDGKRMQSELVEYAANLRNEVLEEAEQAVFKLRLELKGYCPQTLDYARIAIRTLKDCGK